MASDTGWEQRRKPDEVPTPIAVAVSDYCRRAKAHASAVEVREALALVPEQDDFRVRALTDGEPEATPLGPFAVVDILRGTSPQVAAQRQGCGYYDLVQAFVHLQREKTPPPAPAPVQSSWTPPAPVPAPLFASAEADGSGRKEKELEPSLAERIAPKKREREEPAFDADAAAEDTSPFRKKDLPAPRGRFTRVDVQKRPLSELDREDGREPLSAMLEQHRHRVALARALSRQYQGRAGAPISTTEATVLLERHGLLDQAMKQERDLILSSYTEHRGASGRVAWALGVSPAELQQLIRAAEVKTEVDELRERSKREALAPNKLGYRLDLLGRTKYLADLGITRKFTDSLTKDLRSILRSSVGAADSVTGLVEVAARKNGVSPELLSRAVERLELDAELQQLVSADSRNSLP